MRLVLAPLALLVAAALAGAAPAAAHDDDPKLLDRRPAHRGPGFRSGALRGPAGELALQSLPSFLAGEGLTLLAWLPVETFGVHQNANDCWGYVSPSGREYALLGLSGGTAFVDVTSPGDPVVVATIEGQESLWRDVKVYGHYAYAVSEGGGGIQILDLDRIDSGVVEKLGKVAPPGTPRTHNVAVDGVSGFLYRCGGGNEGLRIYDLADPESPTHVGSWPDRYVHDAQVVTYTEGPWAGRQVAFACTGLNGGTVDPGLHVLDVTDKGKVQVLAHLQYSFPGYSHQAWLSEDRQYLYLNDEADESSWGKTATHVIDVGDLANPVDLGVFLGEEESIGHNLYTRGNLIFEANYTAGLRVYDATDPVRPVEVAHFDTWQSNDNPSFHGLWSVYPYLPSGVVIGSDIEKGLFVWWYGTPPLRLEHPAGLPAPVAPEGQLVSVEVVEETPGELVPGSVRLHWSAGGSSAVEPMAEVAPDRFEAQLPALACGTPIEYFVSAQSQNGVVWRSPEGAPAGAVRTVAATAQSPLAEFDFEQNSPEWSVVDDPTVTGHWIRAKPAASEAQAGGDVTPDGFRCYLTGNHWQGAPEGVNDVDGGATRLVLDPVDLAGASEATLEYWRWYSNDQGAAVDDSFVVELSDDGGQSWVEVEVLGPGHPESHGGWWFQSVRVRDHVELTDEFRVRFVASDLGAPSLVEAAVDEVALRETLCGDCNGNGLSDLYEIDEGLVADLDGDGVPDECGAFWADVGALSVSAGGVQSLHVDAGPGAAGQLYWILGSASGTAPGLPLGGELLPLVPDGYFAVTASAPNEPPLVATLGDLDAEGTAQAAFELPAGSSPAFVGLELHHACLVADAGAQEVLLATGAVALSLVP